MKSSPVMTPFKYDPSLLLKKLHNGHKQIERALKSRLEKDTLALTDGV